MPLDLDAVLFDAGGVLVMPDPSVLAPTLAYYGADTDHEVHRRAHYAAMTAKSRAGGGETDWDDYDRAYVEAVGVPASEHEAAVFVLGRTRNAHLWRTPLPGVVEALREFNRRGTPIGVVSNASGQIEEILVRSGVCQVGDGPHPRVRCVVDSHLVGATKPDPAIFDHALVHFEGIDRGRIGYVGDSVVLDVAAASGAGLVPILMDPWGDAADLVNCRRIASLGELLD